MPGQLLTLIPTDEPGVLPEPPEFEALAALHLSGLQNVESAIDLDLLDVAAALADAPAVLGAMETEDLAISAEVPEVATEQEAPVAVDMAEAQTEGNAAMQEHEGQMYFGT